MKQFTVRHSSPDGAEARAEFDLLNEAIEEANSRTADPETDCGQSDIFDENGEFLLGRKWNAPDLPLQQEEQPSLTRFDLSYAHDESFYADFSIEAKSEEEAVAIAQKLLDSGDLVEMMAGRARTCDNGSDNHRVFASHDGEKSIYQPLEEIAEDEGIPLPENWRELQPQQPAEPPKPEPLPADVAAFLRMVVAGNSEYYSREEQGTALARKYGIEIHNPHSDEQDGPAPGTPTLCA